MQINLSNKATMILVLIITVVLAFLFVVAIGPIQKLLPTLSLRWAMIASVSTLLITIGWLWYRSRKYIFQGAVDNKNWRDLRIWASILLSIMIIVYLIF